VTAETPPDTGSTPVGKKRVVYLCGAGASHASVKALGADQGILMRDLNPQIAAEVGSLVRRDYDNAPTLTTLANTVIDEDTDVEHVITFLDESSSGLHKKFAGDLRGIFEKVLRELLDQIEKEHGEKLLGLYAALIDMYAVPDFPEVLSGFLTTNYDSYIERAAEARCGYQPEMGIEIRRKSATAMPPLKILKLHGSFDWKASWPIEGGQGAYTLWIPPGIQKAKDRYPFNAIWGLAREILDCDILRVIGCRLGPNDWDLISLLFAGRHVNASRSKGFDIEMIDSPQHADRLKESYPYLGIKSIYEVEKVGESILTELLGSLPSPGLRRFEDLDEHERKTALGKSENWFRLWLKHMAESLNAIGSLETPSGVFKAFLEE
jgi:hypothetical protein